MLLLPTAVAVGELADVVLAACPVLAGAATVDPGLVPFGSSIEAKSPPAGVAEARDAGEAGAGGVAEAPGGAAGAALAVAVGLGATGALSVLPVPVGAATVAAADPPAGAALSAAGAAG